MVADLTGSVLSIRVKNFLEFAELLIQILENSQRKYPKTIPDCCHKPIEQVCAQRTASESYFFDPQSRNRFFISVGSFYIHM
jgi:hypothetical protein